MIRRANLAYSFFFFFLPTSYLGPSFFIVRDREREYRRVVGEAIGRRFFPGLHDSKGQQQAVSRLKPEEEEEEEDE